MKLRAPPCRRAQQANLLQEYHTEKFNETKKEKVFDEAGERIMFSSSAPLWRSSLKSFGISTPGNDRRKLWYWR